MIALKWLLTASAALSLSAPVMAQEQTVSNLMKDQLDSVYQPEVPEGSVTIYFRGGLAGRNIAEVLDELYSRVDGLPTRLHVIEPNGAICKVLVAAKYPSPCAPYLPLIQRLSSIKNANLVQVGQEVIFPDVELAIFRSSRPVDDMSEVLLDNLVNNWGHLNIEITTGKRDGRTRVEFDTFELRIKADDEKLRDSVVENFLALDVPDTFVETAGYNAKNARTFQFTESQVRQFCDEGEIQSHPVDYSSYAGSAISDLEFGALPIAQPQIEPRVFVLDVEMMASPNLLENAGGASVWECEWHDWKPQYHATHLAGIVGSKTNGRGFIGLEPATQILPRPYLRFEAGKQEIDPALFGRYIRLFTAANEASGDLPIFLMASSYRTPEDYGDEAIETPAERFNKPGWAIERFIKDEEPLLIVAAGQQVGDGPIDIRQNTLLAPQNLGDLPNVISVASCVDCDGTSAAIDPLSNFSEDGMVHVAAPGGEAIPGWVNTEGIGASRGTSQASAFTAGVAARMVARYPNRYKTSERVKRRIQVTSRPMVDEHGDLAPSASKIATGIVDPRLAVLDPGTDWSKDLDGWRSLKVKNWSKSRAGFLDAAGISDTVELGLVRRVVQHENGRFTFYLALKPGSSGGKGTIERKHFFQIEPGEDAALELCDGSRIRLADVLDFLPRAGGVQDVDLGISPCE